MKKSTQLMFHLLFWIFSSLLIILGFQLLSLPAIVLGTGGPVFQEHIYVLLIALPIGGSIFYTSYFTLNFFVKRPIRFIWVFIFYAILIYVLILVEVRANGGIDFMDILIFVLPVLYFNILGFLFKTFIEWITPKFQSCCIVLAVIGVFTCNGCTLDPSYGVADQQAINAETFTEYFYVHASGSTVTAFNGDLILDFPAGAMATSTKFSIVSFPLDHLDLDGMNLMQRGFSIKNLTNNNKFTCPVKIMMRYDLADFNASEPNDESELAISRFYGNQDTFHKVEAIGKCGKNCSSKTVNVSINECGTFVVVEN